MTVRRLLCLLAAAALLGACGSDDDPGQAAATTAATSTTIAPTTSAAATTTVAAGSTYAFRGMTIIVAPAWTVDGNNDGAEIWTKASCTSNVTNNAGTTLCPGFEVYGPEGIANGLELGPYQLDQPYHPGTDVSPCQTAPDKGYEGDAKLVRGGFAKIGTKNAHYREWRVTCVAKTGSKPVGRPYRQRVWYLPTSKILVVDEWSTPGLAEALAAATWG